MVVRSIPNWLKPKVVRINGCEILLSSEVNFQSRTVNFTISKSGWLTDCILDSAKEIVSVLVNKIEEIKKLHEQAALAEGWNLHSLTCDSESSQIASEPIEISINTSNSSANA